MAALRARQPDKAPRRSFQPEIALILNRSCELNGGLLRCSSISEIPVTSSDCSGRLYHRAFGQIGADRAGYTDNQLGLWRINLLSFQPVTSIV